MTCKYCGREWPSNICIRCDSSLGAVCRLVCSNTGRIAVKRMIDKSEAWLRRIHKIKTVDALLSREPEDLKEEIRLADAARRLEDWRLVDERKIDTSDWYSDLREEAYRKMTGTPTKWIDKVEDKEHEHKLKFHALKSNDQLWKEIDEYESNAKLDKRHQDIYVAEIEIRLQAVMYKDH